MCQVGVSRPSQPMQTISLGMAIIEEPSEKLNYLLSYSNGKKSPAIILDAFIPVTSTFIDAPFLQLSWIWLGCHLRIVFGTICTQIHNRSMSKYFIIYAGRKLFLQGNVQFKKR